MTINANTKIAPILRQNAHALEAIISLSPKFEKLRNPLLRKIMAPRTTLSAASKLGGCTLNDFYLKLEPLGFKIDRETKAIQATKQTPHFLHSLSNDQLVELDVRPIIASGDDPLNIIMEKIKGMHQGQVLKIINTFEPTPLILLLERKGFETYVEEIDKNEIQTYFYKAAQPGTVVPEKQAAAGVSWNELVQKFENNMRKIDVRHLEMPQPMHTILEALDQLPDDKALYVFHKRIPVFLLPELAQRGFEYRINEQEGGEVHLLIFRN